MPQIDEEGRITYRPEETLFGQSPVGSAINLTRSEGPMAGFAELAKSAIMGRGGMGGASDETLSAMLRTFQRIARRMGVSESKVEDLAATGMERVLKMPEEKLKNPNVAARGAMRDVLESENPYGAAHGDVRRLRTVTSDLEQKLGRSVGDADESMLYLKFRERLRPDQRKNFTLARFRELRNARPDQTISLDAPAASERLSETKRTLGEVVGGGESPLDIAQLKEAMQSLTPEQSVNIQKIIEGLDVNPAIKARILKKLKTPSEGPSPMSGGSGRPLPPGTYDPAYVFGAHRPNMPEAPLQGRLRDLYLDPHMRKEFPAGNPTEAVRIGPEDMIDPRALAEGMQNQRLIGQDTLPPGIHPGATVDDLINRFKQAWATSGRN